VATAGAATRRKLTLEYLTDGAGSTPVDSRDIPFTLRHAELLTLLALHPRGLTAEQLALQLYGELGNPVTVRAEIHRLRTQLGTGVVQTRPYRLAADIDADFLRVRAALRRADARVAARGFGGPLLPGSEAPAILQERESLTAQVRQLALNSGDPDTLWSFWETSCGVDDLEVLETLCAALNRIDPRLAVARAHRARLR
jgi:hypothetical protein